MQNASSLGGWRSQVEASRAEGMVFFATLAGPAVDAVEGKPDGVDVDERQQNRVNLEY